MNTNELLERLENISKTLSNVEILVLKLKQENEELKRKNRELSDWKKKNEPIIEEAIEKLLP